MSQLDAFTVDPVFGCKLWTGKVGSNGRPLIWQGRTPSSAYVVAWERVNGKVPDELVIDHLCRRPLCIDVDIPHLEPVTKAENERRKSMRYRMRRARCPHGHRLDEATRLLTPEGGVLCRLCTRGVHPT